jgi:putative hydrolase of the HAD superfamily
MQRHPAVRALLFDLGNVLIRVDFEKAFDAWSAHSELSRTELRAAFQADLPYQQHECGKIGRDQYFEHLRRTLKLRASDDVIAAGWNAILLDEMTETLDLLAGIRAQMPLYVFSNSNVTHKAVWSARFPRVISTFKDVFVSCDLGLRKPEPAAYLAVARRIGAPPDSILFFDDLAENVEGAIKAGMQAVHVRSPVDVDAAIRRCIV